MELFQGIYQGTRIFFVGVCLGFLKCLVISLLFVFNGRNDFFFLP